VPVLDAHHDFAHPVEADTAWSESYYFNAYCPVADSGLFTRIGVRPNEGTLDVGLSVWLPNGELTHVRAVRPQHEMTDVDLEAGGVRYERITPMQEWRLTADVERVRRGDARDDPLGVVVVADRHAVVAVPSPKARVVLRVPAVIVVRENGKPVHRTE